MYSFPSVTLSVVIITHNEEANLARTLESVKALVSDGKEKSSLSDSARPTAPSRSRSHSARTFFRENEKATRAEKTSAIDKATGDWILSLSRGIERGDEGNSGCLILFAHAMKNSQIFVTGFFSEANYFLGRWVRHGGCSTQTRRFVCSVRDCSFSKIVSFTKTYNSRLGSRKMTLSRLQHG